MNTLVLENNHSKTYLRPQAPMGSADDAADKVGNMASLWTSGAALFFNSRLPINIYFS